jgi:TRAP-type uncharacterized transport system fused permease subunit
VFVFGPELLWQGPLWKTAVTFGTAAVALICLAAAIENYAPWCTSWWTRTLVAIGSLLMITPDMRLTVVGTLIVASVIGISRMRLRVPA